MITNDDSNVRVPMDGTYGHGRTDVRQVQFTREVGRAPAAHIPGQPYRRPETAEARVATANPALWAPYGFPTISFKRLDPAAVVPALGTAESAGYDLVTPKAVTLAPGERTAIPLAIAVALPSHLHGRIESRSGLALKGLVVLTGVIDSDYRGELKVIMQNFSSQRYEFAAGDRVAQLVLRQTHHARWEAVEELPDTVRGTGGFGSTGA